MKSARLLLVLMCLLIATSVSAAAYEPTNGAALGSSFEEIKFNVKEEVAAYNMPVKISTISVVPIPSDSGHFLTLACMAFYGLALYVARPDKTEPWRTGREFSRFT